MFQPLVPKQTPEVCDTQKEWGNETRWESKGEENTLVPENSAQQAWECLQRTHKGPSLVDIPPCATWEPPEVGIPSLHRPKMVGLSDEYPQATGQGAKLKTRPQYSTKTVAEEMVITDERGQQASTLKIDFYLPLPGQLREL